MSRSTVEYSSAAWLQWVLLSTMLKLKMSQLYAGRAIIGQVMTTPSEAIIAEADLPTIATKATQLSTTAMKKSFLMSDINPRREIATTNVRQRKKKKI